MPDQVESYGLYADGPTYWLLQGRGGTNFVGLKQKTPLIAPRGACNHLVPTAAPIPDKSHWETFLRIIKDPLVDAMLPLPRALGDRAFFVEDTDDKLGLYLACLSRLSSPIVSIVKPAWMVKVTEIEKQLSASNIQPWVISQTKTKQQALVTALAQASTFYPRTVVITGDSTISVPSPMKRLKTNIRDFSLQDLMTLPLENLGAVLIRRYARREDIYAPLESRDARRERMIKERMSGKQTRTP